MPQSLRSMQITAHHVVRGARPELYHSYGWLLPVTLPRTCTLQAGIHLPGGMHAGRWSGTLVWPQDCRRSQPVLVRDFTDANGPAPPESK